MRETVVATARRLRELSLVVHTVGNVSVRAGDRMLITPTRVHPEDLEPEAIVELTLHGHPAGGASLEWPMHAAIYSERPDIGAVVHTHSPYAVARSFDPTPLVVRTEERAYFGIEEIRVAEPADAGTAALARAAVAALGDGPVALLARHGAIGVGSDARTALEMCCLVEHVAMVDHLVGRLRA